MLFFVKIWSSDINNDLNICSQTWRLFLGLANKLRVELIKGWELRQETFTVGIKFPFKLNSSLNNSKFFKYWDKISKKKFESRILSWTF